MSANDATRNLQRASMSEWARSGKAPMKQHETYDPKAPEEPYQVMWIVFGMTMALIACYLMLT